MSRADKLLGIYVAFVCLFVVSLCSWAARPQYVEHHPHTLIVAAGPERSSKWPAVRDAYLRQHPACEACGSRSDLNVHHVIPFHVDEEKELDPTNLITLCRTHHLTIGHLCDRATGRDNWKCENPNVREDAAKYRRAGK